ncbi:permease-like cell division protein FtsX [Streptosporangium sp. NPDC023963]|uniref:permease-like cell division protein FtsX n=1 Tax=Streptosporangium sp. NPDC023963 TaxID=3155608 RepID=UPI00342E70EE
MNSGAWNSGRAPSGTAVLEAGEPSAEGAGRGWQARTWAEVRRGLTAVVVAVAVLLGAGGSVGSPLLQDAAWGAASPGGPQPGNKKVSPPPDDWPQTVTFTVFLCRDQDPFKRCRKRAITANQRRALEARLRAMPEVAEVEFESQEEAYANFTEQNADNETLLSAIEEEDMPESFRGTLHRWRDIARFEAAMYRAPGVSNVFAFGGSFWQGKADVVVSLCGRKGTVFACKGRGPATAGERKAVGDRLLALEESESVYFEDVAHARRVFAYVWGEKTSKSPLPESYYVKLADPGTAPKVVGAVEGTAGVRSVWRMDEDCSRLGIAQEC